MRTQNPLSRHLSIAPRKGCRSTGMVAAGEDPGVTEEGGDDGRAALCKAGCGGEDLGHFLAFLLDTPGNENNHCLERAIHTSISLVYAASSFRTVTSFSYLP